MISDGSCQLRNNILKLMSILRVYVCVCVCLFMYVFSCEQNSG